MSHTVLQIPVPAIGTVAKGLTHVPTCPHITALGPFVGRDDVDDELKHAIRAALEPMRAFSFELSAIGHFGRLTYLAPQPVEPFIELTGALAAAFPQWPPYDGAFDDVVPHLSIGEEIPDADLTKLQSALPISACADEVTLTWWTTEHVEQLARFPLGRREEQASDPRERRPPIRRA